MKVKCRQKDLAFALHLVNRAVSPNTTLPVLNNMYIYYVIFRKSNHVCWIIYMKKIDPGASPRACLNRYLQVSAGIKHNKIIYIINVHYVVQDAFNSDWWWMRSKQWCCVCRKICSINTIPCGSVNEGEAEGMRRDVSWLSLVQGVWKNQPVIDMRIRHALL